MAFSIDDAWDNCTPVARAGNAAFGVYCRCGAWVARNIANGSITEPVVPREVAVTYGSPELASKLVDVGLWEAVAGGWSMPHYLLRNQSAELMRRRKTQQAKRNALGRDPALRHAIRQRDQDRCRYCGVSVNWSDRKGPRGATYDHVDTLGPNTFENLVISCRSCNSAKCDRTLEDAGMTLLAVPGTTRTESRSESKRNLGSFRSLTPPKGGRRGPPKPPALPAPHPFTDDGTSTCAHCPLPESNLEVHPDAA
jgi:5-methylcytosine-specific restriction endonuclease McrA